MKWRGAKCSRNSCAAASLLWSRLALARGSWRATWVAHLAADLAMVALFVLVVMPR